MNRFRTSDEDPGSELPSVRFAAATAVGERRQRRVGWGLALLVATLLTLMFPTQHYFAEQYSTQILSDTAARGRTPWTDFLILEIPVWYLWVAFSPLILFFSRRFPLTGERRYRNLAVHLVVGTVLSTAHITLLSLYRMIVPIPLPPGIEFGELAALTIMQYLLTMMTIYGTIVAVHHAAAHYHESQARALQAVQLQTRLANARLDVLKMQLQPHFLFNTLNTISSLTLSDPRGAQRMIVRLSDLLRLSLEDLAVHEVPLAEEVDFLKRYAEIQQVRFSDRLTLRYDIEPGTEQALVPKLVLQPLVENAIRHAVEKTSTPVRIDVRSVRVGESLHLEVIDDGPGLVVPELGQSTRIGLRNTEARLWQLYGPNQRMTLANGDNGGAVARIVIPLRLETSGDGTERIPAGVETESVMV